MKQTLSILFAVAGLAAWAACGGGNVTKTSGGGTGGSTGGATTGGGGDGGPGGTNGAAASYDGLVQQGKLLAPMDGGAPASTYFATATFYPNIGSTGANCGGTASGSCCYAPPGTGGGSAPIGAGTLTFLDGTQTIGTLPFDPTNGYVDVTNLTWNGGDNLSVKAAGDSAGVGVFTASATAPADFVNLTQTQNDGGTASVNGSPVGVSVSQDLIVTWPAGTAQSLLLTITPSASQPNEGSITCSPNDSDGTVTVSQVLLANYQPGNTGTLEIDRINSGSGTAPNGSVVYQVSTGVSSAVSFGP
ncbi:MAG: hypothetical protein ACYCWW_05140 [Deltaproteobacteria bacterium]